MCLTRQLASEHSHRQQKTITDSDSRPDQNGLSIAAVLFIMIFACEACGSSFNGDRGLSRHQLNCEEFLLADNEASTVDDALEKYRRKLQRKRHKAAFRSEVSLPVTASGVRDIFILISILIIIHHSL